MERLVSFVRSDKLTFVLRVFMAAVILMAAIPKLMDIEKYSVYMIYSYNFPWLLPSMAHTRVLGTVAPYLELLIGLGLLFGVLTRLSAIGWGLMSIVFFIVKVHIIFIQQNVVPCGCFPGVMSNMLVTQSIWLDVLMVPLCAQVIWANRERKYLAFWSLLPVNWRNSWLRYIW